MHTNYCDGNDSAEDMVRAAIDAGLEVVGVSGHAFTPHDPEYCMSPDGTQNYIKDLKGLCTKYSDQIKVMVGTECDYYSEIDASQYDYIIGSLHYMFPNGITREEVLRDHRVQGDERVSDVYAGGLWTDVDADPDMLVLFAEKFYGGDMMAVAELYYETVSDIAKATDCDIIGHFDLITKFNEMRGYIDTRDERYVRAWKKAVDRIFEDSIGHRNRLEWLLGPESFGKPVFEINTGAISRGYRTAPYPAADQIEYIREKGGLFILNSDSHSVNNIAYKFEEYEELK